MENIAIVTIKFSEGEVNILINSLENTLDTEAVFGGMPKKYNTLLGDLKKIKIMIEEKKHESIIDKKDHGPPYGPHNPTGNETKKPNPKKEYIDKITGEEENRNGPEACDNCED